MNWESGHMSDSSDGRLDRGATVQSILSRPVCIPDQLLAPRLLQLEVKSDYMGSRCSVYPLGESHVSTLFPHTPVPQQAEDSKGGRPADCADKVKWSSTGSILSKLLRIYPPMSGSGTGGICHQNSISKDRNK